MSNRNYFGGAMTREVLPNTFLVSRAFSFATVGIGILIQLILTLSFFRASREIRVGGYRTFTKLEEGCLRQ
jgi:hypothetical protein